MPIPSFDQMLRPVLALATVQDISRRIVESAMADQFKLTPSERAQRLASGGSTVIGNRSSWAMTFLSKNNTMGSNTDI